MHISSSLAAIYTHTHAHAHTISFSLYLRENIRVNNTRLFLYLLLSTGFQNKNHAVDQPLISFNSNKNNCLITINNDLLLFFPRTIFRLSLLIITKQKRFPSPEFRTWSCQARNVTHNNTPPHTKAMWLLIRQGCFGRRCPGLRKEQFTRETWEYFMNIKLLPVK